MRFLKAFALGAATAYFFDPQDGRRRRNELRDRSLKLLRRAGQRLVRKGKYVAGQAQGAAAEARGVVSSPEVATDDATIRQRILSDAFRDVPVSTKDVDVLVERGVAKLRGSVEDESLVETLVRRVSQTPGVVDVQQELEVTSSARGSEPS